ncbi:hypothetical protein ACKF11_12815 [Methylobacillus sp. Pita2]|uniref:hypothetical protein n=1 Tax=Methylobacillus sp. Pita2 TaxID=3383245 RepID=UPI0038B4E8DC
MSSIELKLVECALALQDNDKAFQNGKLGSVPHAYAREKLLIEGINLVASLHNVKLKQYTSIDTRGEITVFADGCTFGSFAEVLNNHNPRTGIAPGAIMLPESSWCWVNHFEVESLVKQSAILHSSAINQSAAEITHQTSALPRRPGPNLH